jgi:uncharacterized protein
MFGVRFSVQSDFGMDMTTREENMSGTIQRNVSQRTGARWLCLIGVIALLAGAAVVLHAQQPPQQRPLPPGYARAAVPAPGAAPKMKGQLLSTAGARTFRVTFGQGDEVLSGLTEFAEQNHIESGYITGIGGLLTANLGWGDPANGGFKVTAVDEKCELVSLIGNVILRNGKPYVHAHAIVSLSDGSTKGGHLLDAHVSPFVEIYIVEANLPATPKPAE